MVKAKGLITVTVVSLLVPFVTALKVSVNAQSAELLIIVPGADAADRLPAGRAREELTTVSRLLPLGNTMTYKKYLDEANYTPLTNVWLDTMESTFAVERFYVVQTAEKPIARCMLMVTDPGDLVFDPFMGVGSTGVAALNLNRKFTGIEIDEEYFNAAEIRLKIASSKLKFSIG